MLICLDYDRTYTKDSKLWDSFIDMAQSRGHTVIIGTMRSKQEPIESKAILNRCEVIYTNRVPKLFAVKPKIDIWIDDNPCDITGYPK